MAKHCDLCGAALTEDEAERPVQFDMQVCDDCLHHGLRVLKKALTRYQ